MSKPSNTNNPKTSLVELSCMYEKLSIKEMILRDIFGGYRAGEHLCYSHQNILLKIGCVLYSVLAAFNIDY